IPRKFVFGIPFSRDECGVLLVQDWIKNWLPIESRREGGIAAFNDEFEFTLTYRTVQRGGLLFIHRSRCIALALLDLEEALDEGDGGGRDAGDAAGLAECGGA